MRVFLALMLLAAATTRADEGRIQLRDAPGRAAVEANCVMCHSLDYIQMNSPFLDRKGWEASVNKMIRVMGAPIGEQDAKVIVDYLAAQYGS